jgi:hypothetical protein
MIELHQKIYFLLDLTKYGQMRYCEFCLSGQKGQKPTHFS